MKIWNALLLFALSWATVHAGVWLGDRYLPKGDGYPPASEARPALFRFDSYYYLDIADNGYRYDGDPAGSPNIVFAPLFPLLAELLAYLPGLDEVRAGFALNALLLVCAFFCLTLTLETCLTPLAAFTVLAALGTSAGAYSLHAYYSESTMLAALALALLASVRGWWLTLGIASLLLGASRLAALPMVLAFTFLLAYRRHPAALLAPLGSALYLGYLAWNFGEPFSLIAEIQSSSWGRFHPETEWTALVSGRYLLTYLGAAVARGLETFSDVQTLNLVWLCLVLASAVFTIADRRYRATFAPVFVPYALFVYATAASSPYLISVHRFAIVVVPLFLMGAALHLWLARRVHRVVAVGVTASLLALNAAYGCFHAAMFNQGHWFWF